MREWFRLFGLSVKVKFENFLEYMKVIRRYYHNRDFRRADISLLSKYLFQNPFKMSSRFLQAKGFDEIYAYGETPLTTLEEIAKICEVTSSDVLYEMGCGRGRGCFWLASFIGCRVVGVDFVPDFISKATQVAHEKGFKNRIQFILEDIRKVDLLDSTFIYLYGTCYDDEFIQSLLQNFLTLPPGVKVITISYSLEDYCSRGEFEVIKKFPVALTWGIADAFLQIRKSST